MSGLNPSIRLSQTYFEQEDVVALAKNLIGKELFTCFNGQLSSGIITETEAYAGVSDKASHAFGGRRTARTETMYAPGGTAYVYLCYGIHHLFNVVTNRENIPHAVLVRAVFPFRGLETILKRRNQSSLTKTTSGGPGTVSAALGIRTLHNGIQVGLHPELGILDRGLEVPVKWIQVGKRIGVEYAKEDANLPYRFWLTWEDSKKVMDMLS
ncbi:MAG: DNA-3-methyladenine glycosylase [Bacteroidia bacterium]|nr:DNA-3-methyladenine glycosylase [Bacteroidia bacterium]